MRIERIKFEVSRMGVFDLFPFFLSLYNITIKKADLGPLEKKNLFYHSHHILQVLVLEESDYDDS